MARQMKDSGIEWIGEIPTEWEIIKSKYILSANDGGVWGDDPTGDEIDKVVIRSTEQTIDGKWCIVSPARRDLSKEKILSSRIYCGDLLITKSSGSDLHIGKTTIADEYFTENECYYSNFIQRIRCTPDYNSRFLWYLFNSNIVREQFVYLQNTTSGIGNINAEIIENIFLPYPKKDMQQKIVEFLDKKCAEIDTVIAKTKTTIEEYKKLKQSVITEAVTKGIRGDRPMKDSGIEWIGEIPEGWDCLKAKYLFQEGDGSLKIGPFGSALNGKTLPEGAYKIYNQAHLVSNDFSLSRHFVSESTFKELKSYEVRPGDVLFSMMGTIGKCRIMPFGYCKGIMDSHLLKARLNELINVDYFVYVYDKDNSSVGIGQLNYFSNGSIMSGLNSTIVKNIYIPLPSKEEQKEIADYLDKKCAEIDTLIEKKTALLEEMETYKKSVIYEYVTGKKEIC